ncbi:MAG: hypothetical protein GQ574_07815 [Crocinitomix sp.]|nr:hypothetical protein [Crocinitomix sp.]
MFKKLLLTALLAVTANFGFSQLTVHNNSASSITVYVYAWDGINCASTIPEGSFLIPALTSVPIPMSVMGNVGMRVILYSVTTLIASETEWSVPTTCEDLNDIPNFIVWMGPSYVEIY